MGLTLLFSCQMLLLRVTSTECCADDVLRVAIVHTFHKRRPELNPPRRRIDLVDHKNQSHKMQWLRPRGVPLKVRWTASRNVWPFSKTARVCNAYDSTELSVVCLKGCRAHKTVNPSPCSTPMVLKPLYKHAVGAQTRREKKNISPKISYVSRACAHPKQLLFNCPFCILT